MNKKENIIVDAMKKDGKTLIELEEALKKAAEAPKISENINDEWIAFKKRLKR